MGSGGPIFVVENIQNILMHGYGIIGIVNK